jgi:acetyl esterase/lipase
MDVIRRTALILCVLVLASGCRATATPAATVTLPVPAVLPRPSATPIPMPTLPPPTASPVAAVVHPISRASSLPVVYQIPDMERTSVETEVVYKTRDRLELAMDIYYPAGSHDTSRYPAVILVHGDAPLRENIKSAVPYVSWGRLFAASGMAAVTFNWRYSQTDDILDLVDYVQDHATALRIDGERLCIFAFSAGAAWGITAMMSGGFDSIQCMVAYYGDMRMPLARLQQGSVGEVAPMLIVKAAQDEFVPGEGVDRFVDAALSRGIEVELLIHPTGVHAFDLRNDDEHSREIIQQTLQFIQNRLGISR